MPQDTTIFWDGNLPLPAPVAALPVKEQVRVLELVQERKAELNAFNPAPVILSLIAFVIFFSYMAIRSNRKNRDKIR